MSLQSTKCICDNAKLHWPAGDSNFKLMWGVETTAILLLCTYIDLLHTSNVGSNIILWTCVLRKSESFKCHWQLVSILFLRYYTLRIWAIMPTYSEVYAASIFRIKLRILMSFYVYKPQWNCETSNLILWLPFSTQNS